jgi:tRNA A-37 threonylcarbamoyl transferase component Bud32
MNLQLPNDFRWHVAPEFRAAHADLAGVIASGNTQLIKHGRFRTVYRVHLPKLDVYVKHCRPAGWRAWLRECFRPAKAILEFRKLRDAATKSVPTAVAVAWGKQHRLLPGDSVLITRAIPDSEPLGRYLVEKLPLLPERERTRKRHLLAKGLGRFLADLHWAGVLHPDLHPDNLLLSWHGEVPTFHLLDLHDVQTGKRCGMTASMKNLAIFNRWFVLRATRTDRLRFWKAYIARCREVDRQDWPPENCRELEAMTLASNLRLWRSWAKRCFGNNRRFAPLHEYAMVGHAVKEITVDQLQFLLADPDSPFRQPSALLKNSRSSAVAEVGLTRVEPGAQATGLSEVQNPVACAPGSETHEPSLTRFIYKCFRAGPIWESFINLFRRSSCLRSWQNGHAFRDCLLPTPRPIAVWHRRRFGLCREGYMLTEKIHGAEDLHQFLYRVQSLPVCEQIGLMRQALAEVGRQIRQLHERGWAHRDLKATNILVQTLVNRNGGCQPPRPPAAGSRRSEDNTKFWFIDLVGAWRPWRLQDSRRQKDLSRLNASFCFSEHLTRTDRLRFLRAYMNWNLHGKRGWKEWWRAIAKFTSAKVRQNQNRGRPLT